MLQSNHKAKGAAEMYLQILKKDLKRKRAMNVILLVFIILASMFMSSGVSNIITVTTALDRAVPYKILRHFRYWHGNWFSVQLSVWQNAYELVNKFDYYQ